MYSSRFPHYKDPSYTAIRAQSIPNSIQILAKNEFEKNLFKLMNNTIFDKTKENVHNHVNVRLVMRWDKRSM